MGLDTDTVTPAAPAPATAPTPQQSTSQHPPVKTEASTKQAATIPQTSYSASVVDERDEFGLPISKPRVLSSALDNGDSTDGKQQGYRDQLSRSKESHTTTDKRASTVPDVNPGSPKPQVSEYSHLALVTKKEEAPKDEPLGLDDEWQEMPAYASRDIYDEYGRLVAKEQKAEEAEIDEQLGGASKGYSRVNDDDDDKSVTSMDENTGYLFNGKDGMDDEASKTPLSQMQATKDILTEGQRIAYVGVCRLAMIEMANTQLKINGGKGKSIKKALATAAEHTRMWSQKMIHRLYTHMDISPEEQVMIEQLAVHGVLPSDLTPTLMKNSRVLNPLNEQSGAKSASPLERSRSDSVRSRSDSLSSLPPSYDTSTGNELSDVRTPDMLPATKTLDIDLRWTVLCDLFLVLIADSVYDARSRVLLEKVAGYLGLTWLDICKFEKKVMDALEMQESSQQNWSEAEHMENRRKAALNRRYMMMGLATIGGGLVIGVSGGLMAPFIAAGLATGLATVGVAGTATFLGSAGASAIITSTAIVSGATVGGKASSNRTQHVQTFEYRPLHNNKKFNLIITISGWMSGKEDDVRLPFSTVDPIMGDLFAVLWEPEMLRSMGQTINILATEVLTQSLQQILGSTILVALMASLQLPVVLTKLAYLLDNPWSVSLARASAAGLILADSLISRNLGQRPVTLVGYSLGARVIHSCLLELHKRRAYGLVQNVYLFGAPIVANKDECAKARSAVAGRFVNAYCTNDWILGYLFRATSGGIGRVAGLAPIADVEGIENIEVTDLVDGHMAYRQAIPKLLRRVGWVVIDDEFTEIEDPDPDLHREKQRELMNEIEEARKELQKEPTKKGLFGLFGKNNKDIAKKKDWETYKPGEEPATYRVSDTATDAPGSSQQTPRSGFYDTDPVLFDVDAIRKELALQSTTPSKVHTPNPATTLSLPSPNANLRHSKSFNNVSSTHTTQTNNYDYYYSDDEDEFGNRRTKDGDDNVQMTFGTWDEKPPSKSTFTPSTLAYRPSPTPNSSSIVYSGANSSSLFHTPNRAVSYGGASNIPNDATNTTSNTSATASGHPKRGSSYGYMAAAGAGAVGLGLATAAATLPEESNVWANDDDGDLGASGTGGYTYDYYDDEDEFEEKEVTMSFA